MTMYVDVSADKDFKPNAQGQVKHGQKMTRSDGMIAFSYANFLQPGRYDFENQIAPRYGHLKWSVDKRTTNTSPTPQPQYQQSAPQPQYQQPIPQPQYQTPMPTSYTPPVQTPVPQPMPTPAPMPMPTPTPAPQPTPTPQPSGPSNTQLLIEAFKEMGDRICNSIGIWGQDISMKLDRNMKALDDSIAYLLSKANDKEAQAFQTNQQLLAQRQQIPPTAGLPINPNTSPAPAAPTPSSSDDEPI